MPQSEKRYRNLLKLMAITVKMTDAGWLVNHDAINAHRTEASEKVRRYGDLFLHTSSLPSDCLGPGGLGATQAVRSYFLTQAPIVARDKTTGQPQVNSQALIEWATAYKGQPYSAPAAALYGLRKNAKVLEFCDRYERFAEGDGRIHIGFNPAGTQTGRWTSSTKMRIQVGAKRKTISCNIQQVPSKEPDFDFGQGPEKLVRSMRDVFIADPGCVLLKADYDQLELRLIAYVYGAKRLIGWIAEGRDVHMENAKLLFGLPADAKRGVGNEMWDKARDAAKPCAYAISYQMHDEKGRGEYPKLHEQLMKVFPNIRLKQVGDLARRFFETHPEIKEGQKMVARMVRQHGYRELGIDGRRLYYPDSMRGINQALNFPMQATGAALVNRATIEMDGLLDWSAGQHIRAQVHDELVLHCPMADADRVAGHLSDAMSRPALLGATTTGIPAEVKAMRGWGE